MTSNIKFVCWVLVHDRNNLIQDAKRRRLDGSLSRFKLNTVKRLLEYLLNFFLYFRTTLVFLDTSYRRTSVFVIVDTVTIRVDRTTCSVDVTLSFCWSARALVEVISYTVTVRVEWTTLAVNHTPSFCRSARTFVDIIRYTIAIFVGRTASSVNFTRCCSRSTRTLVKIIRHFIAIFIKRATLVVNLNTCRGVRARVKLIRHTVFIAVFRLEWERANDTDAVEQLLVAEASAFHFVVVVSKAVTVSTHIAEGPVVGKSYFDTETCLCNKIPTFLNL